MNSLTIGTIDLYKKWLSPTLFSPFECSFPIDTCSRYGRRVFEEEGWFTARQMLKGRLSRCHSYKLSRYEDRFFAGAGIKELVLHPDRARVCIESMLEVHESSHAIGHILHSAQMMYSAQHGFSNSDLQEMIERYNVVAVTPHIRDLLGHTTQRYKAAVSKSIMRMPLLSLGLLPYVPFGLVGSGVACLVGQVWLDALRDVRNVKRKIKENPERMS